MPETENLPVNTEFVPAIFTALGTKCPHCGQEFSEEGFHIAVFLYGIFFLVGKEHGYAGITCPRCLNTIIHRNKKQAILSLKQLLTGMIDFGGSVFDPQLRYYSSLAGSPKDIPLIGKFDITYLNHKIGENEPLFLSEAIIKYLEENLELEDHYLCSYIQDENCPAGTFSNIWWINPKINNNEDAIQKLIQLENIKGIKIFPRYYHRCKLIEDVDRFCWKYGFMNIYLENLKNRTIRRHEDLEQALIVEGIDFKDIAKHNPDTIDPDFIEYLQAKYKERNSAGIFNVAGDFLDILIADPDPWGSEGSIGQLCKGFWKTKNPFTTIALPLSMTQFSPHPFKETSESQWLQQAKSDILPEFTKPDVQTYLMQNYASFIREYAEIIQNRTFCYVDLWILKEKYLKELHALVQEETKLKYKNRFSKKDGFWIVAYENNQTLMKDYKGFTYIHYLIDHKGKEVSYFNLNKFFDGEGDKTEAEKKKQQIVNLKDGFSISQTKQEIVSREDLIRMNRKRQIINAVIEKAKEMEDYEKADRLLYHLDKLDNQLKSCQTKKGNPKYFKKVSPYKDIKDKIDKAIHDSIGYLNEYDKKASKHLKDSIKNKNGEIWYEPAVDAGWYTG